MNQKFGTPAEVKTAEVELQAGDQVRIWMPRSEAGQQARVIEGTLVEVRHYPCGDIANVDVETRKGLVTIWEDEYGSIEKVG